MRDERTGEPITKHIIWLCGIAFLLRMITIAPLVIDVDEAWFAASGTSLSNPFDYFSTAIDNKPPGTAWFYWAVNALFHTGPDPRVARLVCTILIAFAAALVGRAAARISSSPGRGWLAGLTLFVVSALPSPELFSTTTEALMLPGLCFGMCLLITETFKSDDRPVPTSTLVLSGLAFSLTLVLKQTAAIIIPAGLFAVFALWREGRVSLRQLALFAAAMFLPFASSIAVVGSREFWHWTMEYPATVLSHARGNLFSQWRNFWVHLLLLCAAIWPVARIALGHIRESVTGSPIASNVIAAWLAGSLGAVLLGKGLFHHYFQLLAPPLALVFALHAPVSYVKRRVLPWIGIVYACMSAIAATPSLAPLWGTDLAYYERVGRVIERLASADERVLVWGGNAIPLAASGRLHPTPYVTARYAVPPYSTPASEEDFRARFVSAPPKLIVDTHLRGDSGFNVAPSLLPWLGQELEANYVARREPSLPWVTFYVRSSGTRAPASREPDLRADFEALNKFTANRLKATIGRPKNELLRLAMRLPSRWKNACELARLLIAWDGLRTLIESRGLRNIGDSDYASAYEALREAISRETDILFNDERNLPNGPQFGPQRSTAPEYLTWLERELKWHDAPLPLSLESWNWITSLALVELQPVSSPRN